MFLEQLKIRLAVSAGDNWTNKQAKVGREKGRVDYRWNIELAVRRFLREAGKYRPTNTHKNKRKQWGMNNRPAAAIISNL